MNLLDFSDDTPAGISWQILLRGVATGCIGIVLVAVLQHLFSTFDQIGGEDFFFYVCTARDMVQEGHSIDRGCYAYFPGVYAFWRTVFRVTDGSLATLQMSYLGVLLVNASFVAAVVLRVSQSLPAAIYAATWYLILCLRFEGLGGLTEPIATVPFLIGILLWNGTLFRGLGGWISAGLLGAALGLTLYTKQQAGLLSLGALWFLGRQLFGNAATKHDWTKLLSLPFVAAIVFLTAVLFERRGLDPLTQGLSLAARYPTEGSWKDNLMVQANADPLAGLLFVFLPLIVLLVAVCFRSEEVRAVSVAGFVTTAGLATLLQFGARHYRHYSLLGVPCLVIGAVVIATFFARRDWRRWGLLKVPTMAALAFAPLLVPRNIADADDITKFVPYARWHRESHVAQDLERVARIVQPADRMQIIPPRRNSVHFLLETRGSSRWGYSFIIPELSSVDWKEFDFVLHISDHDDEIDQTTWPFEGFEDRLQDAGFLPRLRLDTMTLYARRAAK